MKKYQLYDDNNIDENETVKPDEDFAGKKKFLKKNKYDVDFEQKLDRLWKKAEIAGFSGTQFENAVISSTFKTYGFHSLAKFNVISRG